MRTISSSSVRRVALLLGALLVCAVAVQIHAARAHALSGPYVFCQRSYTPYDSCEDSNQYTVDSMLWFGQYSGCVRVDNSSDIYYYCSGSSGNGGITYGGAGYPHGNPECHEHSGLNQGMHCDFWIH